MNLEETMDQAPLTDEEFEQIMQLIEKEQREEANNNDNYGPCCSLIDLTEDSDEENNSVVVSNVVPNPVPKPELKTKLYECENCDYVSVNLVTLKHHKIRSHNIAVKGLPKLTCEHCDYFSYRRENFTRHQNKHLKIEISCDMCSFTSFWKESVEHHLLSIHGIRNEKRMTYKCAVCGYLTYNKSRFESHAAKHNKEKEETDEDV